MNTADPVRCTAAALPVRLGMVVLGVLVLCGQVPAQEPAGPAHGVLPTANGSLLPSSPTTEIEPNDDPLSATPIGFFEYGVADISPEDDIDWWRGDYQYSPATVFAFSDTSSSAGRDSVLGLYISDGAGYLLVELDDDDGPDLSSCIAGAVIPGSITVFYRVNEDQGNEEIIPYTLHRAEIFSSGSAEWEPNNDSSEAQYMDPLTFQAGSLPAGDPADWYRFRADAGDLMVVILDDDPDDDGNLLDSELSIVDSDGATVLAAGDNGDGDGNCAGVAVAPATGTYHVQISDGGDGGGDVAYQFLVLVNGEMVPVELQQLSIE